MKTDEFKQKFLPLSRRLYTVAWRMTGNRQDAEDIVQECYLKLWNKRNDLSHVVNIEAYAVTLIKRMCYDAFNARRSQNDTEINDTHLPVIDDSAEQKDDLNHVQQFIEQLPDQQKMVIRMREIDDCSFEEIEQHTGLTSVNIRVLLSRARKRLREQFKDLLNNENR